MDITQIVIISSLILITIVVVVAGVWLILIFKELRNSLKKADEILDDTKTITSAVAEPVSSISEFIQGFKNGVSFFNSLFKKKEE